MDWCTSVVYQITAYCHISLFASPHRSFFFHGYNTLYRYVEGLVGIFEVPLAAGFVDAALVLVAIKKVKAYFL